MTTGNETFIREIKVEHILFEIDLTCDYVKDLCLPERIVERLRTFNEKPCELRQAIIECARRIEKTVPAKVRQALDGSLSSVQLTAWKLRSIGFDDEKTALIEYGNLLRDKHAKETDRARRTVIEKKAAVFGIVVSSQTLVIPWEDEEVRVRTLCLVNLATGLPVLQKSGGQKSGLCWTFEADNRRFSNGMGADVVFGAKGNHARPISKDNFRLPHFLEIVAMLCSVSSVDGLPNFFAE